MTIMKHSALGPTEAMLDEIGIWLREYHFLRWARQHENGAVVRAVAQALPRYVIDDSARLGQPNPVETRCALLKRTPATEAICDAIYADAPRPMAAIDPYKPMTPAELERAREDARLGYAACVREAEKGGCQSITPPSANAPGASNRDLLAANEGAADETAAQADNEECGE